LQNKYYFSDINNGVPDKTCFNVTVSVILFPRAELKEFKTLPCLRMPIQGKFSQEEKKVTRQFDLFIESLWLKAPVKSQENSRRSSETKFVFNTQVNLNNLRLTDRAYEYEKDSGEIEEEISDQNLHANLIKR